jgi:proteasome lid subunit RPN8/RPN11
MNELALPTAMTLAIHDEVAHHGAHDVETGMFLLAAPGAHTVHTLALAGTAGVTRHREQFALTGRALNRLFSHARREQLEIVAQIHSHAGRAFLSEVDLRHGFAVEGFTTSVIPSYRHPPVDPAGWGWWRHDGRGWQPAPAYAIGAGHTTIITFDERTIDAR